MNKMIIILFLLIMYISMIIIDFIAFSSLLEKNLNLIIKYTFYFGITLIFPMFIISYFMIRENEQKELNNKLKENEENFFNLEKNKKDIDNPFEFLEEI